MGLYHEHILPHVIDCVCGMGRIQHHRALLVPRAQGTVLEVGLGSGLNLPHYALDRIQRLMAIEPSAGMRRKAQQRIHALGLTPEWIELEGDLIPLPGNSVDTIVITYTLCTIPDVSKALSEMHRLLKPGGQLLFSEHGKSPDGDVFYWQEKLTPLWRCFAGGCHLNRDIPTLISDAGFQLRELDQGYIPQSPRFAGFNYRGIASVPAEK
ncbi:MAG: methyltransferase domain-containing protein [Hahellaceae bacterium]|jgi:ubiquinone/menaquinone biosynthesis C-methylase UbiE|nr:methyltransferase domain-containing protein [Hahellaceae bacterium]